MIRQPFHGEICKRVNLGAAKNVLAKIKVLEVINP